MSSPSTANAPHDNSQLFTIQNNNGIKLTAMTFGGRIKSLYVPDKNGVQGNIVLGYTSPRQYFLGNPYFGAMIGRYGNRIERGKFRLERAHSDSPDLKVRSNLAGVMLTPGRSGRGSSPSSTRRRSR